MLGFRIGSAVTVALMLLAGCESMPSQKNTAIAFALIGDNPYVEFNEPKYDTLIDEVNATAGLGWVIHLGDVKGGGQSCSDEVLTARFELNARFRLPFILTPGDNDWFDCHRETAGGYDPRERLGALRRIWYPAPGMTTGTNPFPVTTQANTFDHPDFVENVYWRAADVIVGTAHMVGTTPGEGGIEIHEETMAASLAWIEEIFAEAERTEARGVFIATQVDPYLFGSNALLIKALCKQCPYVRPGYEALDKALIEHSHRFGKPVVLAVGDTHIFRVDKPLYDGNNLVENFTRVEGFGHPTVHWVRVVIDPASNEVFRFNQELIEANYGVGPRQE